MLLALANRAELLDQTNSERAYERRKKYNVNRRLQLGQERVHQRSGQVHCHYWQVNVGFVAQLLAHVADRLAEVECHLGLEFGHVIGLDAEPEADDVEGKIDEKVVQG